MIAEQLYEQIAQELHKTSYLDLNHEQRKGIKSIAFGRIYGSNIQAGKTQRLQIISEEDFPVAAPGQIEQVLHNIHTMIDPDSKYFRKAGEVQDETLYEWMNDPDNTTPFPDMRTMKEPMLVLELNDANREYLSTVLLDPDTEDQDFWVAYQHLSLFTESAFDPWSDTDELGNKEPFSWQERYEHGTIGFITELGELLDICKKHRFYGKPWAVDGKGGIVEELGDALWYASIRNHAGYFLNNGLPLDVFGFPIQSEHWNRMLPPLLPPRGEIMECLRIGATHAVDPYWTTACLSRIREAFEEAIQGPLPSWRQIAIINIEKLHGVRYPGGFFSQRKAIDRDLDAEEKALQSGTAPAPE